MSERELLENILKATNDIERRLAVLESRTTPQQAYKTCDAAKLVRLSEWTLRQGCNKNKIRGAYKGNDGKWRVPHSAIQDILANGLPKQVG